MLVVLDSILNRITENRAKGRKTYIFIDEIYLLFQKYGSDYYVEQEGMDLYYSIEHFVGLQVNLVKIFILSSFGEQGGVGSATVLSHKVKPQVGVLAKRVTRLLGECKIGVAKSVMFGISNLIFHCKYPFLKMISFGINYQ